MPLATISEPQRELPFLWSIYVNIVTALPKVQFAVVSQLLLQLKKKKKEDEHVNLYDAMHYPIT